MELARSAAAGSPRAELSLTFSALAGAFFVGVAGARWITNEVDKRLLKESAKLVAHKSLPPEQCERVLQGPPRRVLEAVEAA